MVVSTFFFFYKIKELYAIKKWFIVFFSIKHRTFFFIFDNPFRFHALWSYRTSYSFITVNKCTFFDQLTYFKCWNINYSGWVPCISKLTSVVSMWLVRRIFPSPGGKRVSYQPTEQRQSFLHSEHRRAEKATGRGDKGEDVIYGLVRSTLTDRHLEWFLQGYM